MKKNKKWFSLIIAMWIVLVISLLAYTILEYIVPFWKDIKWVENTSKAYYQANSAIEDSLYYVYERNYSTTDTRSENVKNYSWVVSNMYTTTSSWKLLPPPWEWNSEYDKDRNTISEGNPIQIAIWNWYISSGWNITVTFNIPSIWWTNSLVWINTPIINWQLSSNSNTLNAKTGNYVTTNDIKSPPATSTDINLFLKTWTDLSGTDMTFTTFYNSNCNTSSKWCILKLSVINKLDLGWWKYAPYLEWKMDVTSANNIPLRYTIINSSWKSYWFKKDIKIKIPAPTVNEAFDFTVFQ